jgi:glycosyltransferase involved in cell wall biosynthesis
MHVRDNYVEFGYDPEKISVVPHPVDEKFSVAHESSFTEPFRLLYVGSLSHHKGVEKLVPVVAALNQSEYEFYLTIVGTGGLEDEMQSQVRELGVKQRVDFRGFVSNSDLPAVYSEHDLFLYPGIWEEPLGRVYLEALATGTPIVSSDYGSIEDIVGDAGVLTDGSVEDFRGCILSAVESGMLPAMSSAAKEQVRQFELSHVIEGLEGIYRGAING